MIIHDSTGQEPYADLQEVVKPLTVRSNTIGSSVTIKGAVETPGTITKGVDFKL